MLVLVGAGVSDANELDDTPLLAAVGEGELELAEMLASKGANVETVREDVAELVCLDIVSQQPEMLKLLSPADPKDWNTKTPCLHPDLYFWTVRIEA